MNHCLKKFHNYYQRWEENRNDIALRECYEICTGINSYGNINTSFYVKCNKIWLRFFYPKKVKNVIFSMDNLRNFENISNHLGIQVYEHIRPR